MEQHLLDPDAVATSVAAWLRQNYLFGVVGGGLAGWDVSPAELPTLLGFMFAEGVGSPRWPLKRWIKALAVWIADRAPLEKGVKIRPSDMPMKAYPNWLKPHEIEAWIYARDRAGLRIDGIADNVRARLRTILADTITGARPRADMIKLVAERMAKSFSGVEKDWERIAVTELAAAFNEGVVTAAAAKGVSRYTVATQTDACSVCKSAYVGKVFTHAELLKVVPPTLHPRCRCVPIPVHSKI